MKAKKIICGMGIVAMISTVHAISYGDNKRHEIADSYWSAIKNNDVIMTTEEKIEYSTMVIPIDGTVEFETSEELDGKQYGYITIRGTNRSGNSYYTRTPASSEKNIANGLYKNKFPMIKSKSGREDIKWYYYPSVEYSSLVFIKFSLDGFTSEWVPITGIPLSPEEKKNTNRVFSSQNYRLTKKIEVALDNPTAEKFKLEGIRVIYGCDINVIENDPYQTYRFVNDDKQNAQAIISAGAKYMELKESVLNIITYEWNDHNQSVTIKSIGKINFFDEMTKKALCKEKFEEIQHIIDLRYYRTDILNHDRAYYEALSQTIKETELTEKQRTELGALLVKFLEKYDELANKDTYDKNFRSINIELSPFTEPSYNLLEHDKEYYEAFYNKIQNSEMTNKQKEDLTLTVDKIIENYDFSVERKLAREKEEMEAAKLAAIDAISFVTDLVLSGVEQVNYITEYNPPVLLKGNKNNKNLYVVHYEKSIPHFKGPGRYEYDFNHQKFDALLKVYNINLEMLNTITNYLICNELSEQDNLSKCYKVKNDNGNQYNTELEYFIANFDEIYCDSNENGWHYPSKSEIDYIQTKHKKNVSNYLTGNSLTSGDFILHK